eukprot:TRINITY_DN24922_c0_g1_i1.p1 TRINITY_DN24922_c0_g1~~TRINITY_DN24922_c0_g1_i1.p1  ORF type:complete len:118 (-),score=24.05 TRINITY_DN24922_c0_g1_i1:75-428(-)
MLQLLVKTAVGLLSAFAVIALFHQGISIYYDWSKKRRRLAAINTEYEALRSVRVDAVYHHGWASSRGDHKEADSHEKHVMEIDKRLECLRKQYEVIEAGGDPSELEALEIDETPKDR